MVLASAGLWAAWRLLVRIQGDSEVVFGATELQHLTGDGTRWHGEMPLCNGGRQLAVIRRVDGRIVDGPAGRVDVTRQGSRPPERGFWASNLLEPGDSCVAEVDVELESSPAGLTVIELDVHEIGRRPLVHRRARFSLVADDYRPPG